LITAVERSTEYPEIQGSNPALGEGGREREGERERKRERERERLRID
jgi:hypothetical protein